MNKIRVVVVLLVTTLAVTLAGEAARGVPPAGKGKVPAQGQAGLQKAGQAAANGGQGLQQAAGVVPIQGQAGLQKAGQGAANGKGASKKGGGSK